MRSLPLRSAIFFMLIFGLVCGQFGAAAPNYGTPPTEHPITTPQYQEKVENGTLMRYQFQAKTSVQFYGNVTATMNMSCDADAIGDQNISIDYRAQNEVALQIRLNATNEGLALTAQNRLRVQNGSIYQYKYLVVCNISRNTTEPMTTQLRLRIQEQDRNSTWAWYNATSGEFECVQSWYENGELVANTTHFSTFVVLTGLTVPLDWWWYVIIGVGVVGLVVVVYIIMKKKTSPKPCANGKPRNADGSCPQ